MTGCKGVHPLSRLPGFKSTEEIVPDAMHTIKNVVERIYNLITGRQCTNIEKILKSEQAIGRNYKRVTPVTLGKRKRNQEQGDLSFVLTKHEKDIADQRCNQVVTPAHIDYISKPMFCKKRHMKSHDWKQVSIVYIVLDVFCSIF